MTTTKSTITAVGRVVIPTVDVDRAIDFYVGVLGFTKTSDVSFGPDGAGRWVEVSPPSGTTPIALTPPPPGVTDTPKDARIILTTHDIDAEYEHLRSNGVDTDEVSRMGDPVPPMLFFRDPEGNSLIVVEES